MPTPSDQLSHDDRILVMQALTNAIETGAETITLSRSTIQIVLQMVREGAVSVAAMNFAAVQRGETKVDTRPAAQALIAAGWTPPGEAVDYNEALAQAAARFNLREAAQAVRDWGHSLLDTNLVVTEVGDEGAVLINVLDQHLNLREYPKMNSGVTIRFIVVDADEKDRGFAASGATSTSAANHELSIMMAALELERARALRGVEITPEVLFRHVMRPRPRN